MIKLIDGNNLMRRGLERQLGPASSHITVRQLFETSCRALPGTEIWAWDGRKHNERRRAIYPNYKVGRTPTPEDIFAQIHLWRELLRHAGQTQVEVHGWEADDIISTLTRKLAPRGVPIEIHSNDMDYAQLAQLPNVKLIGVNTKGVPGRWVPLYKAMNGDTSDRIKGIPGFGPKRWLEMENHWPQIERAIVQGDPAAFVGLPFKPAVAAWLASQENVDLLRAMLTVTYFENVPDDELEGGIIEGHLNYAAGNARLGEFFL